MPIGILDCRIDGFRDAFSSETATHSARDAADRRPHRATHRAPDSGSGSTGRRGSQPSAYRMRARLTADRVGIQ